METDKDKDPRKVMQKQDSDLTGERTPTTEDLLLMAVMELMAKQNQEPNKPKHPSSKAAPRTPSGHPSQRQAMPDWFLNLFGDI
jgi:hypothetical protein